MDRTPELPKRHALGVLDANIQPSTPTGVPEAEKKSPAASADPTTIASPAADGNEGRGSIFGRGSDNIKVGVRVRPENARESGSKCCLTVDEADSLGESGLRTTATFSTKTPQKFVFDVVFDPSTRQEEVFAVFGKPIAESVVGGYNATVFAYGQTGSGKTFTMTGAPGGERELRGLTPRVLDYLFALMRREERKSGGKKQFECRCSYLEIYKEHVSDLLQVSRSGLAVREDMKRGVFVENLSEHEAASPEAAMALLDAGLTNRRVGMTAMNAESSRSHSVFTLHIQSRETNADGLQHRRYAGLHLIDLAGSERQKLTQAEGERLREANAINKSLSCLGNVIHALSDIAHGRTRHVHYRDSKLTFLLKDSLGGNSKTAMIANVSPSDRCFAETLSTLRFAQRVKRVQNRARVNEDTSGSVARLRAEVARLRSELRAANAIRGTAALTARMSTGEGSQTSSSASAVAAAAAIEAAAALGAAGASERERELARKLTELEAVLAESLEQEMRAREERLQLLGSGQPLDSAGSADDGDLARLQSLQDKLALQVSQLVADKHALLARLESVRKEKGATARRRRLRRHSHASTGAESGTECSSAADDSGADDSETGDDEVSVNVRRLSALPTPERARTNYQLELFRMQQAHEAAEEQHAAAVRALEEERRALEKRAAAADERIAALDAQLRAARLAGASADASSHAESDMISQLQEEKRALAEREFSLEQQVEQLTEDLEGAQRELAALGEACKAEAARTAAANEARAAAEAEAASARRARDEAQFELEMREEGAAEAADAERDRLEAALADRDRQLEELAAATEELTYRLEEATSRPSDDALEAAVDAAKREAAAESAELRDQLTAAQRDVETLRARALAWEDERAQLTARSVALESDLAEADRAQRDAEALVATAKAAREEASARASALESDRAALEESWQARVDECMAELRQQASLHREALEVERRATAAAREAEANVARERDAAISDARKAGTRVSELEEQVASLERALESAHASGRLDAEALRSELAETRQHAEALEHRTAACQSSLAELQALVDKRDAELSEARANLAATEEGRAAAEARHTAAAGERDALAERVAGAEAALRELEGTLDHRETLCMRLNEKLTRTKGELQTSLRERQELLASMRRLKAEEESAFQTSQGLRRQLEEVGEERTRLAKLHAELEARNDELVKINTKLTGHGNARQKIEYHARVKEQNNELLKRNAKLEKDLERVGRLNARLEEEVRRCRAIDSGASVVDIDEEERLRRLCAERKNALEGVTGAVRAASAHLRCMLPDDDGSGDVGGASAHEASVDAIAASAAAGDELMLLAKRVSEAFEEQERATTKLQFELDVAAKERVLEGRV